ncbi:uncharacterized protein LOC117293259 [Asterias rubens]|uniref:uncharacterized protein LOC117293259 n=1 Tax=Asterias rubens TaxID=7604 RepID=UPI0014559244|nr:uncharacterized protein LOC117293259 [Asterias rubens]
MTLNFCTGKIDFVMCSPLLPQVLNVRDGQFLEVYDSDFLEYVLYSHGVTTVSHLDRFRIRKSQVNNPSSSATCRPVSATAPPLELPTGLKRQVSLRDRLDDLFAKKKSKTGKAKNKRSRDVRIQFGWMHRASESTEHKGVRSTKGGGTRCVEVAENASYKDLCDKGVAAFFLNGNSPMGSRHQFQLDGIGTYQQLRQDNDGFNLAEIIAEHGNPSKTRIYMFTTAKVEKSIPFKITCTVQ